MTEKAISRRTFLGRGVASVVGAGIGMSGVAGDLGAQSHEGTTEQLGKSSKEKPQIKEHRRLGRTEWQVSDISFGSATMTDPALLEYAMERGMNYVDTARQYYDMEVVIGKVFPEKRDKLFVTTKLMPELITADVSADAVMAAIDESLERLNTDYIDCCMIHSVGDPNLGDHTRVGNENIYTAFENARKAGKIRFWGASSHGPKMFEDFTWLMDNTNIDVIMAGMNFLTRGLEPILAKAREKDIGVVAMKTLSAARKVDFSAHMDGRTIRQALIKWMLAQPNINTLAITMSTFDDIDEFVAASGKPTLSPEEKGSLGEFGLMIDRDYCRPGCRGCLTSCPGEVRISDIMRYSMYFNSYGREKYAMGLYAALPESQSAMQCASCSGPCVSSCPHNIPIRSKLLEAHSQLTL